MPDSSAPQGAPGASSLRLGIIDVSARDSDRALVRAAESSDRIEIAAVAAEDDLPGRFGSVAKGSPDAVVDDPRVEAIYLAGAGSGRLGWVERAARAGKHVLCEPPIATSVADAAAMFAACSRAGVLLAEADVGRFHPRTSALIAFVRNGSIGELRVVTSEATSHMDRPPRRRHEALWQLGVDVLQPILQALPDAAVTAVTTSPDTVTTTVHLTTPDAAALAICSFELAERQALVFRGTTGTLAVDRPFDPGPNDDGFVVQRAGGTKEVVHTGAADPREAMLEAFADACGGVTDWPIDQGASMALVGKLAEIVATLPDPGAPGGPPDS